MLVSFGSSMLIKLASLLFPQVIVFTPIITSVVIAVVGAARVARQPEKRSEIAYVHGSLLLLLSFLVLPATSMKILRVLTPCFKLKTNGVLLHYVRGGLFVLGGAVAHCVTPLLRFRRRISQSTATRHASSKPRLSHSS